MRKTGMRWARHASRQALAAMLVAMTGCQLSRADAWDDKHKRVPPTLVETQLSQAHVAAGQQVTVRCAATRGDAALADVATSLAIAPQQTWDLTHDAEDPHAHTLVPTTQGTYHLTCAASEAAPGQAQVTPHTATLHVEPAVAVRWQAKVASSAVAGTRVAVQCTPVDAFDNVVTSGIAKRLAAGHGPGFTIWPDAGVDTEATSFIARAAGVYTVTCNAHGGLEASSAQNGRITVQPAAPHLWWSTDDDAPLAHPRAAQCVSGDAPLAPPYTLRDRFNNPIDTRWRVQRVQADGSVVAATTADTAAPGVYRFTPVIHEFTEAARLHQAAFDMLRDPPPPQVDFDDAFEANDWHVQNASDVQMSTRITAACSLRDVYVNSVPHPVADGVRELSLPYRVDTSQWGLLHLVVQAANQCGGTTQRIQSYIASPRFARPDVAPAAATLAWAWSEGTWQTLLQQAWSNAWAVAPSQVSFDGACGMPAIAAGHVGRVQALGRQAWAFTTPGMIQRLWHGAQPAEVTGTVHYAGAVAHDALHIDAVAIDPNDEVSIRATWTHVVIPGTLASGAAAPSAVALHLPQVQATVTATIQDGALRAPHVQLDVGDPSLAKLVDTAHPKAELPALRAWPEGLVEALQGAWSPSWTQALQTLHHDLTQPPASELPAQASGARVVADTAIARTHAGTWVQEARARYSSPAWHDDTRLGAAVHPTGGGPGIDAPPSSDRLLYSDDGINTMLWSMWATDGFAIAAQPAPLKEVALTLPVVWRPAATVDSAILGVAARVQLEADGHTYEGDMQGHLPVHVTWVNNHLQVEAHPTQAPKWAATADQPDEAQAFSAAASATGLDAWILERVNQALLGLPQPELLRNMPEPCHWQADAHGAKRAAQGIWTEVNGRAFCPAP